MNDIQRENKSLMQCASEIAIEGSLTIDLMRHGETIRNAENLVTGRQETPLSPRGKAQTIASVAKMLRQYDIAWISTLQRTHETLDIVIEQGVHIDRIIEDARLDERSKGLLEGKHRSIINPNSQLYQSPPGGENLHILVQRISSFLHDLFLHASNNNSVKKIFICSHSGPIRIIRGILEDKSFLIWDQSFQISNSEIYRINTSGLKLPII